VSIFNIGPEHKENKFIRKVGNFYLTAWRYIWLDCLVQTTNAMPDIFPCAGYLRGWGCWTPRYCIRPDTEPLIIYQNFWFVGCFLVWVFVCVYVCGCVNFSESFRKVRKVLVKEPEENEPPGRSKRRWNDNIKRDLTEVGCDRVNRILWTRRWTFVFAKKALNLFIR
jgi:hypothetical protein